MQHRVLVARAEGVANRVSDIAELGSLTVDLESGEGGGLVVLGETSVCNGDKVIDIRYLKVLKISYGILR